MIGILTKNFEVYYELIKILRSLDVPFMSLTFSKVPNMIDVIITTDDEKNLINHKHVVSVGKDLSPYEAVERAIGIVKVGEYIEEMIIGIDPGKRPGVVVLSENKCIAKFQTEIDNILDKIYESVKAVKPKKLTVRIGDGDPPNRNRIINNIMKARLCVKPRIEIVDERFTTKRTMSPDIDAAHEIARMKGKEIKEPLPLEPKYGEISEIKRRSRMESDGEVTISSELAEKVAKGMITIEDAIKIQKNHKHKMK